MQDTRMKRVVTQENAPGQRADRRALAEINDLIDDGVYDAASVLAWEVQRHAPGDPTVWLMLARIDYLRERYAAAMYAARMATRLDPASSAAWFALASTAVTRSRWRAEGLDAALQATALAPGKAKNWTVLAQLQLAGGAPYEAAVAAERAVRVDPTYRGGHLMLGEIALDAGEWAHAETAFRQALDLNGADRDARDGLVEALEAQDRDPAEELDRYGPAVEPAGPATRRVASATKSWLGSAAGGTVDPPRPGLPALVIGSLTVGLLLGAAVPGLGIVRGLVGAAAVILMGVAVRPVRVRARTQRQADAGPPAGTDRTDDDQAAGAEVEPEAVDEVTANVDGMASTADVEPKAGDDETVEAEGVGSTADVEQPPDAEPTLGVEPRTHADIGFDIPDDPAELAELSRARLAAADLELAHAAASRLEAVAPGSIEAHRALAAVALAEQDYEQARMHYLQVLEIEPLDQEAHERLALVSEGLQRSSLRLPPLFRGRR